MALVDDMINHIAPYYTWTGEDDELRRCAVAALTWRVSYSDDWLERLCDYRKRVMRTFMDGPRCLPYVRDLIEDGFRNNFCQNIRFVCLSNSDVCIHEDGCELLRRKIILEDRAKAAFCLSTHETDRVTHLLSSAEVEALPISPGIAVVIISREWWSLHGDKLPDLLMGAEGWDSVMRTLVTEHGLGSLPGFIYHERHNSYWSRPENRCVSPGQVYNRELVKAFYAARDWPPPWEWSAAQVLEDAGG